MFSPSIYMVITNSLPLDWYLDMVDKIVVTFFRAFSIRPPFQKVESQIQTFGMLNIDLDQDFDIIVKHTNMKS